MDDCYPDNPCTNYPRDRVEWCARCLSTLPCPSIEVRCIDGTIFRTDYYADIAACESAIVCNAFAGTLHQPHGVNVPCTAWISREHVVAIILRAGQEDLT